MRKLRERELQMAGILRDSQGQAVDVGRSEGCNPKGDKSK